VLTILTEVVGTVVVVMGAVVVTLGVTQSGQHFPSLLTAMVPARHSEQTIVKHSMLPAAEHVHVEQGPRAQESPTCSFQMVAMT